MYTRACSHARESERACMCVFVCMYVFVCICARSRAGDVPVEGGISSTCLCPHLFCFSSTPVGLLSSLLPRQYAHACQCVAVCCSVLQCVAVCCSVLQCVAVCCSVFQFIVTCCSLLQRVAVCYSVLQRVIQCADACCHSHAQSHHFRYDCAIRSARTPFCFSLIHSSSPLPPLEGVL